jgi:hypothetical protein
MRPGEAPGRPVREIITLTTDRVYSEEVTMPITGSDREFAVIGRGTVFDGIAYWVTLAGIYLMVGGLMFLLRQGQAVRQ